MEDQRKKNAEACRRHREKRKREIESLRKKVESLEQERPLFLDKIAELELSVDSLRMNNTVNLEKENELLKMEIKRHRAFVRAVLKAAENPPELREEEEYRLLKSGLESGKCQVLGLCYASTADPSWQTLPPIEIGDCKIHLRYQFLPHGAVGPSRRRINLRLDYTWPNLTAEQHNEVLWKWSADLDHTNNILLERFARVDNVSRRNYDILPPSLSAIAKRMKDDKVAFHRHEETGRNEEGDLETVQMTLASTSTTAEVYPAALLGDHTLNTPVKAFVQFSKSMKPPFQHYGLRSSKTRKVRSADASLVKGTVVYPCPDDPSSSNCTLVVSVPLDPSTFKAFRRFDACDEMDDKAAVSNFVQPFLNSAVQAFWESNLHAGATSSTVHT